MSHSYGDPAVHQAIAGLISQQRNDFANDRTYVAATRRTTPADGAYWLPLGPPRSLPMIAASDASNVGLELGRDVEFVIAACEAGRVVSVLDQDGDPLAWDARTLAGLDQDVRAVWAIEDGEPHEAAPADTPRAPASEQLHNAATGRAGRTPRLARDARQARNAPGGEQWPRRPRTR